MWSTEFPKVVCSVEGCSKPIKTKGFCANHYARFWRNGTTDKLNGDKRKHPLYIIWWQRKQDNCLCESWLNFDIFVNDVEPKPEGNYFLVRIKNAPFGPDNFKWQEHLKRKQGESNKDWWARKRASRISASPSMESDRNLRRKYNIIRSQYEEKLKNQNYVCAICEQKETSFDGRAGSVRKLAVDHCHKSEGIRELLCNRCNTTLGKVEDNVELLEKMKQYLIKHGAN